MSRAGDGAAIAARHGQRGRLGMAWLLIGIVAALLLAQWLGAASAAIDLLAPGATADSALLGGLLTGGGLAYFLGRQRQPRADAALYDQATGLLRRAPADAVAATLVARDERDGASRLALVVVGIEGADATAQRYGQRAVEQLLAMVAVVLRTQCRGADLPFRLQSRELAVYLHSDGIEQAEAFVRRIGVLLASQQLDWRGDVLKPVVRSAIVMHRVDQSLEALTQEARQRLAERTPLSGR